MTEQNKDRSKWLLLFFVAFILGWLIHMKTVFTNSWWKAAGIRALKTMAQTATATIGTSAIFSSGDWRMVISSAVLAGILSLLTSVAGIPEVEDAKKSV